MTTFECIFRSEPLTAPLKYHFRRYRTAKPVTTLAIVRLYGIVVMPSKIALAMMWMGMVSDVFGKGDLKSERKFTDAKTDTNVISM